MVTKSKKAPTKKTARAAKATAAKNKLKSKKAVCVLTGFVAVFCVLDMLFATVWFGEIDWVETSLLIIIAVLAIFACAAYKKRNIGSAIGLSGAMTILMLTYHIIYLANAMPYMVIDFSSNIWAGMAIILDILILVALAIFACVHFGIMAKDSKKAVTFNWWLSIVILVISLGAMINNVVLLGAAAPAMLAEALCYYAVVISTVGLTYKIEEGKK